MLAQIVTPASSIYLYDLVLENSREFRDTLFSPSARPRVGIIAIAKTGYTIVKICSEKRTVQARERVIAKTVVF